METLLLIKLLTDTLSKSETPLEESIQILKECDFRITRSNSAYDVWSVFAIKDGLVVTISQEDLLFQIGLEVDHALDTIFDCDLTYSFTAKIDVYNDY